MEHLTIPNTTLLRLQQKCAGRTLLVVCHVGLRSLQTCAAVDWTKRSMRSTEISGMAAGFCQIPNWVQQRCALVLSWTDFELYGPRVTNQKLCVWTRQCFSKIYSPLITSGDFKWRWFHTSASLVTVGVLVVTCADFICLIVQWWKQCTKMTRLEGWYRRELA